MFFRQLNDVEEQEFRQWARENFDPSKDDINTVWHPVVQQECADMIKELGENILWDDILTSPDVD